MSTCNCERCAPHLMDAIDGLRGIGIDTDMITAAADAAGMTLVSFMTTQLEEAARAVLDGRTVKK